MQLRNSFRCTAGGDRVTGRGFAGRSTVIAPHAMAATSQPLATQIAVEILRRGGHAVDAAIAANVLLGLVEPMSCGLGGDLFALVWPAGADRPLALNASGRTARALSLACLRKMGLERMPLFGPLSVTVPGVVDGWWELHQRFGRLPFADLLEPTIRYARDGFPVTDLTAHYWRESAVQHAEQPGFRAVWMPGGQTPRAGERVKNPALARTLSELVNGGRDAFYSGEIAAAVARAVQDHGGGLSVDDLGAHISAWVDPISVSYRGHDVWQLPPNSQGLAVLQMLNLLEGLDVAAMGFGSADYLHHLIEAKKLAFEDRARYYADPDFSEQPIAGLLSKPYADDRRRLIDPARASSQLTAGDPRLDRGDTVCIVTADRDRNMVSMMQSLFLPMGSGVTPRDLGFVLQNRGALFALTPEHANAYAPGKRPFHTILPSFASRDGKPYLCFGVMGGAAQPQAETQVLLNLIDFGMGLQEAGDAPRALHEGSSEPTGERACDGGTVLLESAFPYGTVRELMLRGHRVGFTVGLYGGYQAIHYNGEQDVYHGASECRQDGQAAGF